ncbi:hypothetical protein A6S26_24245 [Nostoc sp. ATCC 43529]|nr:hypothetical protein A6S26_24245 [Nostoc sp. ATCC 43529]
MAYKDISRGVRLAKDHEKYMLWLNKDTQARQQAFAAVNDPTKTVKTARVPGFIVPFDSSGTELVYVPAKLISPSQSGRGSDLALVLKGLVDEFTFSTTEVAALTTPNVLEGVRNFKFAKLTVTQRVTTATAKSASRITGREYYRHENDSVTAHFGKKLASSTYSAVMDAISEKPAFTALFQGSANATASRYRFVPEGA